MVHGELGAQNTAVAFLLYAIANWLLREYRNVSEGEGRGLITSDGLFSLTKIMLQIEWWRWAWQERRSSVCAPVKMHGILT